MENPPTPVEISGVDHIERTYTFSHRSVYIKGGRRGKKRRHGGGGKASRKKGGKRAGK